MVHSWEMQHSELNPEDEKDAKKIEEFLWDSKKDRNNTTLSSIATEGQKIHGIVTIDGKIIDGNRRAMLLNKIRSNSINILQQHMDIVIILKQLFSILREQKGIY